MEDINKDAIDILNKLYIESYFKDKQKYEVTKSDIILMCLRVLREIERVKNN